MGRVSRTLQGTARAAAAKGWYQTIEFAARQAARALVLAVPGGLRLLLDRVGQLGRACGLADAPQFDNAHGSPENKSNRTRTSCGFRIGSCGQHAYRDAGETWLPLEGAIRLWPTGNLCSGMVESLQGIAIRR